MSGFIKRNKTVNPAGGINPAQAPNVGQYGWTSYDAANVNQLIQYVDAAAASAKAAKDSADYVDGKYQELQDFIEYINVIYQEIGPIFDNIDLVYKDILLKHTEVTSMHSEVRTWHDETLQAFDDAHESYLAAEAEAEKATQKAIEAEASAVKSAASAVDSAASAKTAADIAEELRKGQVYRGTWNIEEAAAFPPKPDTNSVWDITLKESSVSYVFNGETWFWGDRLLYLKDDDKFSQIESGSGVISVNGKSGAVTLNATDVGAIGTTGGRMTGKLQIYGASSQLELIENDQTADKTWRLEAQNNNLDFTESGAATRLRLKAGGGADLSGDLTVSGAKKVYHEGFKPTAADVGAVGKTGNQVMTGALAAVKYTASDSYAYVSASRSYQGTYLGNTDADRRTIIGGGGTAPGDALGSVLIRPNGITDPAGVTLFNADGTIANASSPTHVSHLTNKGYVDSLTNGKLNTTGGDVTGKLRSVLPLGASGFPNNTNDDANNFRNRANFSAVAGNNGLHIFGNNTENSRTWGIQSGHESAGYTNSYGSLLLNPYGGAVYVGHLNPTKGALRLNNKASISYQDSGATVFHNYAQLNGMIWATGNEGEKSIMTLASNGILRAENAIYGRTGVVARNQESTNWISIEAPADAAPYIATKTPAEAENRVAMRFGQSEISIESDKKLSSKVIRVSNDGGLQFAPTADLEGHHWGMGVHPTSRTLSIHRYQNGVWQQSPMEFAKEGTIFCNSNVFSTGSINSTGGYLSATRDANPMLELHSPGKTAGIIYLPGVGRMRFSQSNGAGGEAALYAELQSQFAHFVGSVRPDVRSASWGQWGSAIGGIQDNTGNRTINPGQWHPMITSASYVDPIQGYAGRWSLGYYRPGSQHNGEVVLNMNGDGALRNNLRFVYSGAAGGRFGMDGSDAGQTWAIQEGGFLYGSSFGATYQNMVNWCTGSFAPISDSKLKRNIRPATKSALDDIAQIEFKSYEWNEDAKVANMEPTKIGLVAQEMEAIDPSYTRDIQTFNPDGSVDTSVKGLDVTNMLALALKAIQEQQVQINELKEKLNDYVQ